MNRVELYIIELIVLVILSGIFSGTETAFSCASRIKLINMANDRNRRAERILKILDDYDRFLTTILIGNNLVNIACATIGTLLFTEFFAGNGPTISTLVITVITLIFGEITPKSIAKEIPERFAGRMAGFVVFCEFIFTPVVFVMSGIKKLIKHFFKFEADTSDIADELITMVDEAEKDGDLEEHESDLISAAIEFNDLDVGEVLTPRVEVVAVDLTMPLVQIENTFRNHQYSRLPVYENSIDNIVGVIHEKDFYEQVNNHQAPLKKIIKPIIYSSGNQKISALLKQFQTHKIHLAVVLDEFGGTEGIITLEDIIEELVGEIWDENDTVEEYYRKIDDHVWLFRGDADADDLFDCLDVKIDEEEDEDFISVSGWVIHQLKHIPLVGEEFDFKTLHVTVTGADQRKVIEIRVEEDRKEKQEDPDRS